MSKRFVTIHFMDGTRLSVSFPPQAENLPTMASRVQKALDANQLAFEADGELIVIPATSVKYMAVSPAPERLPDTVVRGASLEFD